MYSEYMDKITTMRWCGYVNINGPTLVYGGIIVYVVHGQEN